MNSDDIRSLVANEPDMFARAIGMRRGRGRRYWCPFCQTDGNHRTPDVSIHDGFIKCHRCGERGTPVSWTMKLLGIDFNMAKRTILSAYGLSDMSAFRLPHSLARREAKPRRKPAYYSCFDEAIEAALLSLGDGWRLVSVWWYNHTFAQTRFERDGEKTYRPVHNDDGKWYLGMPKPPRPLYMVHEAISWSDFGLFDGVIAVTEGEKACDAAWYIGIPAVCSAGGANGAPYGDWSKLAGRDIVVLPDDDEAGYRYAKEVRTELSKLRPVPSVREVRLGGGDGYDIYDFVRDRRAEGLNSGAIRRIILQMYKEAGQ